MEHALYSQSIICQNYTKWDSNPRPKTRALNQRIRPLGLLGQNDHATCFSDESTLNLVRFSREVAHGAPHLFEVSTKMLGAQSTILPVISPYPAITWELPVITRARLNYRVIPQP